MPASQSDPARSGEARGGIPRLPARPARLRGGAKCLLAMWAWGIDVGVKGEPTNRAVQLFHGGAWVLEVELRGVSRHQSRLEEGVNAIDGMARLLRQLDVGALAHEPDPAHAF